MNLRAGCAPMIFLVLCTTSAPPAFPEAQHYPKLIRGELPVYPSLARTAHITGVVRIMLTIKGGLVTQAEVESADVQVDDPLHRAVYDDRARVIVGRRLSEPSVANVKTWRFERTSNARFEVTYIYRIEGEVTPLPENPVVQLDLPYLVRVTAKPFRPTQD